MLQSNTVAECLSSPSLEPRIVRTNATELPKSLRSKIHICLVQIFLTTDTTEPCHIQFRQHRAHLVVVVGVVVVVVEDEEIVVVVVVVDAVEGDMAIVAGG